MSEALTEFLTREINTLQGQNSSSFFRFSERGNGTSKRPIAPSMRTDSVGNQDNLLWEEPVRSRFSAVAKTCLSPLAVICVGEAKNVVPSNTRSGTWTGNIIIASLLPGTLGAGVDGNVQDAGCCCPLVRQVLGLVQGVP